MAHRNSYGGPDLACGPRVWHTCPKQSLIQILLLLLLFLGVRDYATTIKKEFLSGFLRVQPGGTINASGTADTGEFMRANSLQIRVIQNVNTVLNKR